MKVISVPRRLKFAVALLLLCIPLVVLEVIIVSRAPWWKLPYRSMGYWAILSGMIFIPIMIWMISAKAWVLKLLLGISVLWLGVSGLFTIQMHYPLLGFYTVFISIFLTAIMVLLKLEMERSYFDPQIAWFQGLPKPIPGLKCQLKAGEKEITLNVSRIDRDGVFLFCTLNNALNNTFLDSLIEASKVEMTFNFRSLCLICKGVPTLSIGDSTGLGIRFLDLSPDLKKDLGDFVEVLRSKGFY